MAGLHGASVRAALGDRLASEHEVPPGEQAKSVAEAERLWSSLRLDRAGTLVALGGGSTTDLAGFVAATYLRSVALGAGTDDARRARSTRPSAARRASTSRRARTSWARSTGRCASSPTPTLLETLPPAEITNGLAEVVKTGLLAGEAVWELPRSEQVRRCAAFKAAICLRDPLDRAERTQLNLGHTFAHALEAASGLELPHGRAVALGLLAALRLSGLEEDVAVVSDVLRPEKVSVDRDAAWAALARDKKNVGGSPRLVLLDAPGKPRWTSSFAAGDVRAALDELIA